MSVRGKYIVLEGDEGAGKTEQIARVQQRLEADNHEVIIVREPGGDAFAEEMRQLLKHGDYQVPAIAEALAFSAARASMLENVVRPVLNRGAWVLSDRSYISTIVYQGLGHGLDSPEFRQVVNYAIQAAPPNLTVIIDISLEESHKRQAIRNLPTDRFDLDEEFRRCINEGYRNFPSSEQIVHVDGHGSMDEVESRLVEVITAAFRP